jgi:hypothetical protein
MSQLTHRFPLVLAVVAGLLLAAAAALPARAAADPFQVGLAVNGDLNAQQARSVGARVARLAVPLGASAESLDATVAAYSAQGVALVLMTDYGYGRVPAPQEVRVVGSWARRFGTRLAGIELGNETFSAHARGPGSGGPYGRAVAAALDAIQAGDARVPLLVQADDGNTRLETAVRDMFAAAPELRDRGANVGWTLHPYGTEAVTRMDRLIAQVERQGGAVSGRQPVWITEWGLATDGGRRLSPHNYGWNPAMSFGEAAGVLRDTVEGLHGRYGDRLRAFLYYQREDQARPGATSDREGYFGVLRKGGGDKGPLTAEFRRLTAAYPG